MKYAILLLKLFVVSGCAYWVYTSIDIGEFKNLLLTADFKYLALAVLVFFAGQVASSERFRGISIAYKKPVGVRRALRAHFMGLWYNQVLPGSMGGDVVKVVICRPVMGTLIATKAALYDRFFGFSILMLSNAAMYPYFVENMPPEIGGELFSLVALVYFFAVAAFVFGAKHAVSWLNKGKILHQLTSVFVDFFIFMKARPLFHATWTSLAVHFAGIGTFWFLAGAFYIDASTLDLMALVPLLFIVNVIPLSIGGWGLRETGAIVIFAWVGISASEATVMSLAYGFVAIISSLPGLFLGIYSPLSKK